MKPEKIYSGLNDIRSESYDTGAAEACHYDLFICLGLNHSYLEKTVKQKAFSPHHRRISGLLFIKVNCFHLDLHSVRHALFNRNLRLLHDQFLCEYTGQASLATTVWTPTLRQTRGENNKLCLMLQKRRGTSTFEKSEVKRFFSYTGPARSVYVIKINNNMITI